MKKESEECVSPEIDGVSDLFSGFNVLGEFGGCFTQTRTVRPKQAFAATKPTNVAQKDCCNRRLSNEQATSCKEELSNAQQEPTLFKVEQDDLKLSKEDVVETPDDQDQDGFLGFVCRWPNVLCRACNEPVAFGTLILPAKLRGSSIACNTKDMASEDFLWIHVECKDKSEIFGAIEKTERSLCKHWNRTGKCVFGNKCYFRHYLIEGETRQPVKEQRTWGQRRRKVRNSSRASVFRRFLLEVYGEELLQSGAGVLDIAGGKGELAFELVNLNSIPCTTIEPRKLRLNQFTKRLKRGMYHRNRIFAGGKNVTRPMGSKLVVPQHIQICLDDQFLQRLDDGSLNQEFFQACLDHAASLQWNKQGLNHDGVVDTAEHNEPESDDDGEDEVELQEVTNADVLPAKSRFEPGDEPTKRYITRVDEAAHILTQFSVSVGMHPDQATEVIVDIALSQGKPFAVVPCCVYSVCFPKRALKDGTRVTSYEEFVAYLIEKDPERIKTRRLGFEGKNIVVYCHGRVE